MTVQRDLEDEQDFLDQAHQGLEAMRADANRMLESVLDLGRGGTFQSRTERDIVVRTSLARLAQLDIGDQALCFGRIDRLPEDGAAAGVLGEAFHIGRLAVSGEDHDPLVVDWRAPVAEPFYRATGLDPQGLARRRHLAVRGRNVVGLEDEYFVRPGADVIGEGEAAGDSPDGLVDDGLALGGPGALLAALGQVRTGHMGDIVATIQREQDEIIRSPLAGALMVQGGPGTGKTAVALHRAAYLLYTHRFPLERQGVLVVGPNPLFLRYIEQVLPSLGETGVTLSTVPGLVSEIRVRGVERSEVARLKGEARMVRFVARAVRTRERPLRHDVEVPFGSTTLRLTAADSAEIIAQARRRPGPHNGRRRFVEQQVLRRLADQYRRFRRDVGGARGVGRRTTERLPDRPAARPGSEEPFAGQLALFGADPGGVDRGRADLEGADLGEADLERADLEGADALLGADPFPESDGMGEDELDMEEFGRRARRVPALAEALDRMWPRLAPHELLHDLFGARPLLAAAGEGILSPAEQASLYRPRSSSLEEIPWTAADAALVDEARTILGPRRTRTRRARVDTRDRLERAREETGFWPAGLDTNPTPAGAGRTGPDDEGIRSYGHIVVDEIQDLSPLQLRMLARRSLSGSMTVVGDIAQATGPWAPSGWDEIASHLTPSREPRLVELTVSYRTPAEVVAVAAGVLAEAAPGVTPPRPVRSSGNHPTLALAAPGALAARVAEVTRAEVAAVAPGRTAVLVPRPLYDELRASLVERGLAAGDPRDPRGEGLAAPLVVLPADEANGLEFDSVVVVEPALVAAGDVTGSEGPPVPTTRGLRTLYVALTRPTRRLAVVHSMPLPAGLTVE